MKDRKRAFMGETIEWKGKQEEKSQMANSFTWANERTEKEKKIKKKLSNFILIDGVKWEREKQISCWQFDFFKDFSMDVNCNW